jgi:tetratricopeptide (TPR) repeat protein
MASIIEGYSYDIFISYRQKDNKHDGWVTKFVDNLKGELESTFKEDISIYFDENPHDRLQETHNVDKSLEDKLKCLIFIPILSQTYCDPNSYAWQYEFLTFLRMVEKDCFGKDVKLRSGNVASRLLPIRIHDLEQEDIKLFENEAGNVLRALDFLFKTATGVSRPLKANEDHPQDNLNKTFYTDQINKVGRAIKEIILGMKTEPVRLVKEKTIYKEPTKESKKADWQEGQEKTSKINKLKLYTGGIVFTIMLIAAIIVYPLIFKQETLEKIRSSGERISVAVMPFQNMTNDTIWDLWQGGIQNELFNALSNSEELTVRQIESINDLIKSKKIAGYASITPSVANKISQQLNASVFVFGSIKQAGTKLRINAQVIDSKSNAALKSFQIEGSSEEDSIFQLIDPLSLMLKNFLVISKLEKETSQELKVLVSTFSPEAYRHFINGKKAFSKLDYPTAVNEFSLAIQIDSNFIYAMNRLSFSYYNQGMYDKAKKWCLIIYEKRGQMTNQERILADFLHAVLFETPFEAIKYLKQLQELDDQEPGTYYSLGNNFNKLYQYDKAILQFEKALYIYGKWNSKPAWGSNYTGLGEAYHKTGQFDKEKFLYLKAEKDFPDHPVLLYQQIVLYLSEGDTLSAEKYIEKGRVYMKENSFTDADIATKIAEAYAEAGLLVKAEWYYRIAISFESDKPDRMNNFAYFLINNKRNINEGLQLVNKALELKPNNYNYLHTKGWGLYNQNKFLEALDVLQKSWNIRREKAVYNHEAWLHLEAAKKVVSEQK